MNRKRKPKGSGRQFFKGGKKKKASTGAGSVDLTSSIESTAKALAAWRDASRKLKPPQGYSLDPWQQEAVEALLDGASVIVDAPTTAGKTRVVEEFFNINIKNSDFRACYTTPVKSLSNDKLREFRETYGDENVGISTGDIKDNLGAPIVVATLESYRNSLLGVEPDLGRNLIVFDEYHYIQDSSRGSAWEESMILTPPTCQLLMLSASVKNSDKFAAWLESLQPGRRCQVIRVSERPVPLEDLVFFKGQWLTWDSLPKGAKSHFNQQRMKFPIPIEPLCERIAKIDDLEMTPTIIYAGRRKSCEQICFELRNHVKLITPEESKALRTALDKLDQSIRSNDFLPGKLTTLIFRYGLAYHHSGLPPSARIAIEHLLKDGLLKYCVATMGLSLGINFSVRSAVISDYRRPGDDGFVTYTPSEVLQMLGRAGRRGRDVVGLSFWPTMEAYKKLGGATREDCYSRLRNDPTTYLGLKGRGWTEKDIEKFYKKSFLNFCKKSKDLKLISTPDHEKALGEKLPCESPSHCYGQFRISRDMGPCAKCDLIKKCHSRLNGLYKSSLARLQVHLHQIKCLDSSNELSPYGSLARFFPQSGGLLLAEMLFREIITEENLLAACELITALCVAHYKEPRADDNYEFPFNATRIQQRLELLYPDDLFEELYDTKTDHWVYRDFNPNVGYATRLWLTGCDWGTLLKQVTTMKFGEGDLMNVFYRSATFLQSMTHSENPAIARGAKEMRDVMLRDPLILTL